MLAYLALGAIYAFAAAVQPGPLQTYLVSRALSQGWRRTLPAAFSPLLSDGPIIVLVLLALSRVPAWLIQWLRIAGGAFVLWLSIGAARAWLARTPGKPAPAPFGSLWSAAVVNLLNPNPYIGWSLVMAPLLLQGWREEPARGIALLAGFYITMVMTLAGIIMLSASAGRFGPRVRRTLIGLSAIALAGFGCYLLWSGLSGAGENRLG
jgi:threonine/homoserine/homoserine lactone efflux protein